MCSLTAASRCDLLRRIADAGCGFALGCAVTACAASDVKTPGAVDALDRSEAAAPASDTQRSRESLVDPDHWQPLSAAEDPFMDRPADVTCPEGSQMSEVLSGELVYSVDTGGCSYLTARQLSLVDVLAGDILRLRVWHFALNAGESAMAHVAVQLGDVMLLDTLVPIPAPGGLLHVELTAPAELPSGAPVTFHLHNHGDNSWSFVELSAGPQ